MDKQNEAKQLVQKILTKNPDKADALLVLGMIYLHQDKYADAKKVLEHGAQLAGDDPDFHALLARVAEDTNDDAEALRQYTRLAELRPSDAHAISRRNALQAALNGKK
jgi:predicted Zn-dependent protease